MAETMAQNEQVDELSILDNISDENSIQLDGAMNEVFGNDEPGKFLNGHESKDKNYMVYEYTIKSGGTPESVKYQAVNQGIAKSKNGIQITDANVNEYDKDYKFKAGEKVYVRIPKTEQKETKHVPGKVEYVGNKKDELNRNWKYYSYTFLEGGTEEGVMNKWKSQIGSEHLYDMHFCDENGDSLQQERFGKGETIFIKIPNVDIVDSTPEITIDEIMSISDNDLDEIWGNLHSWDVSMKGNKNFFAHCDKKGYYLVINGKKMYWGDENEAELNKPYFSYEAHEAPGGIYNYAIRVKKGNNDYEGVFDEFGEVYRGKLVRHKGADNIVPEHYYE